VNLLSRIAGSFWIGFSREMRTNTVANLVWGGLLGGFFIALVALFEIETAYMILWFLFVVFVRNPFSK
jgi:hypothetical protein